MNYKFFGLITLVSPFVGGCLGDPPPGVTEDDLQALADRVVALEESSAQQSADYDSLSTELQTHYDSLAAENQALEARIALIEASAVQLITEDTTFTVGAAGDYVDLPEALAALDHYRIASDVTVTLQLQPGTYDFADALRIQHPNGDRIAIVGDMVDPATTTLRFNNTDGVVVAQSHALGRLDGVTITQTATLPLLSYLDSLAESGDRDAEAEETLSGVQAGWGGTLTLGDGSTTHVVLQNWSIGLHGTTGGSINADDGVQIESCALGVKVELNGLIHADDVQIIGASDYGMLAENGGVLFAYRSDVETSDIGILARKGSIARVEDALVTGTGRYALYSGEDSYLYGDGAQVTGAFTYGAKSSIHSVLELQLCSLGGNNYIAIADSFIFFDRCTDVGSGDVPDTSSVLTY